MKESKRKQLADAGWTVGSAADFLELSEPEMVVVNIRVALARSLRETRTSLKLSQANLAKRIGSSQSRVAKMEAAEKSVSIDMYVRSLAALGLSQEDIGGLLTEKHPRGQKNASRAGGKKAVRKR